MIKAVLFDLDGTLLPMDQDLFVRLYYTGLAKKIATLGYNEEDVVQAVNTSVIAMIKGNGEQMNQTVFWNKFAEFLGEDIRNHDELFNHFYLNEFQRAKDACKINEKSRKIVKKCKENGLRVILATSPLFPKIATEQRIGWAGFEPQDFEFFTTYEDYHFCKPNVGYYKEVLAKSGLKPEECLMVGNDALEDMSAKELGMQVFLLTDCLINRKNVDINNYPNGNFDDLEKFIESLNK